LSEKELRVRKIENGTVIDHISAGYALKVLKILGITGKERYVITISMNVPSQKLGRKDILKIEDRELKAEEVDKIALISPNATINIIRDFRVVKKMEVKVPDQLVGFPKCINPNCITNSGEPVHPKFRVNKGEEISLRCMYCNRITDIKSILTQLESNY